MPALAGFMIGRAFGSNHYYDRTIRRDTPRVHSAVASVNVVSITWRSRGVAHGERRAIRSRRPRPAGPSVGETLSRGRLRIQLGSSR